MSSERIIIGCGCTTKNMPGNAKKNRLVISAKTAWQYSAQRLYTPHLWLAQQITTTCGVFSKRSGKTSISTGKNFFKKKRFRLKFFSILWFCLGQTVQQAPRGESLKENFARKTADRVAKVRSVSSAGTGQKTEVATTDSNGAMELSVIAARGFVAVSLTPLAGDKYLHEILFKKQEKNF